MKFSLTVLPQTEQDISAAYRWYEEKSPGLGSEFLRAVDACLGSVQRSPLLFPAVHEPLRRALVRRFPFGIYFLAEGDRVVVLACFHCRRDPTRIWERAE